MLVEYKMLKSEKLIEDHAYTYISGNFIHFPHRVRLKECLEIIKKNIPEEVDNIVDFGGAAGFLGDFLSKYKVKIKYQKIYDVKHPLIKGVTTNFYKPDLKTNYYTFDMNIDDYNIDCINSNSLIICSETLEHIGDPLNSSKKLINLVMKKNAGLYISYPIETGIIGFSKFFQRFIFGRYKKQKRSINSIISQFMWLLGLKKFFRKKKLCYSDHDGFNDKSLTKFIFDYSKSSNIKYTFMRGFSTIHWYLKK